MRMPRRATCTTRTARSLRSTPTSSGHGELRSERRRPAAKLSRLRRRGALIRWNQLFFVSSLTWLSYVRVSTQATTARLPFTRRTL